VTPHLSRRRAIAIPGGAIAAWEFGPPHAKLDVVFLHANGFNACTYTQILAPLATEMRLLAIDMRGHGLSTLPTLPEGHTWQIYADDLLAVLAALGERPRVLAGHSMGGATALLAAAQLAGGEKLSLVLFDPVIASPEIYAARAGTQDWAQPIVQGALRRKPGFARPAEAMIAYHQRGAFKTWPEAMLADYLRDGLVEQPDGSWALSCAPAWEAANFAAFATSNPIEAFGVIEGPVHILKAERDSVCALNNGESPLTVLPSARLDMVADTSHFLPMERPDLVHASLRAALGQAG
jgi:pimeloyl-ACP methyl ester carboxylesterase